MATNPAKTAARLVQETDIDAVWNGEFHHTLEHCLTQTWQWERQDMPGVLGGFGRQGFTAADSGDQLRGAATTSAAPNTRSSSGGSTSSWPIRQERRSASATRWDLALQKARLGLVVLMTSPGVPMLLAGQEFGDDSERTIDFWPLDWGKLDLPQGRAQFEFCQQLLRLRREHPALRSDFVEFYWDDFPRFKVLRYKRWDGRRGCGRGRLEFRQCPPRSGWASRRMAGGTSAPGTGIASKVTGTTSPFPPGACRIGARR